MEGEIALMDSVLNKLSNSNFGSVPELIDGFQKFPLYNSDLDKKYRIIEDELIRFKLVEILRGGDNSTINGYYDFTLSPLGRRMMAQHISVRTLYEKQGEEIVHEQKLKELTLENLESQKKIREQEQKIRDLTEEEKRLNIVQKYWWLIGIIATAFGYLLKDLL